MPYKKGEPRKPREVHQGIELRINKNFVITSDVFNWILTHTVGDRVVNTTYFSSLGALFRSYMNQSKKDKKDLKDIESLRNDILKTEKEVEKFIEKNIDVLVKESVEKEIKRIMKSDDFKKEMKKNAKE